MRYAFPPYGPGCESANRTASNAIACAPRRVSCPSWISNASYPPRTWPTPGRGRGQG